MEPLLILGLGNPGKDYALLDIMLVLITSIYFAENTLTLKKKDKSMVNLLNLLTKTIS